MATLSVFGLGYVGCVSAACFAREGHTVIGVDVSESKVDMINRGVSTIVEEGIGELVSEMVAAGRLSATSDVGSAVRASSISMVAVGTPSRTNGSIDLRFIERVAEEIGAAVASKSEPHTIVIRSTILPGTIESVVIPALERTSGRRHGEAFLVCSNPEFLREGTSIKDFYDPPFTVVGALAEQHASPVLELYAGIGGGRHVVPVRVAEMLKYACNSYHGVKVAFANEIGSICKALGIDSHAVMRLFAEDRKLNISAAYLKPGFAFGGSCLPKDLRAIVQKGRVEDVDLPLLQATLDSNRQQIERVYQRIISTGKRRIGVVGLAFKEGTDDLRESPMVTLLEMLLGKGCELAIYDHHVSQARLIGSNREYIEREIPHIWSFMRDSIADVIASSDLIVIGAANPLVRDQPAMVDGRMVFDLVRAFGDRRSEGAYDGLSW
jgi:GDP-mannose 6-dehydrogenase